MNETNAELDQFISEFKGMLLEVLDKTREQVRPNNHPLLHARLTAKTELLYLLIAFLNKRETDMQKLKSDLIRQVISLDELDPIRKHSELEEKIKEAVETLEQLTKEDPSLDRRGAVLPGRAIKEDIEWGHFSAKVSQMRTDGKIPNNITTSVRGEKFFLVRLPKGETVKPRKKRDTATR